MKKYLGIDWGEKRIGLALGDDETRIATPFKIVKNIQEIMGVVKEYEIDEIVLGVPFKIIGDKDSASDEFKSFYNKLKGEISIPIQLIDERLSSRAADSLPGDKKTKASRDSIAAMLILEDYINSL